MGELLSGLIGGEGFTGRASGGKSRWTGKKREPVPLRPKIVAEVSADHIANGYICATAPGWCASVRTRNRTSAEWSR